MAKRYFGHQNIRLIIGSFGRIFSNLYYARIAEDGTSIESLTRTPIRYLPSSASNMPIDQDNLTEDQIELSNFVAAYPRISFEFKGLTYDSDRQLPTPHVFKKNEQFGFTPAPYNLQFEVRLASRDQLRALEILEQILPWFRPNLTLSIKHEVFDNEERDLIVSLESVDFEDDFEDMREIRHVEYVLQFSVKTSLWGPATGADLEIAKYAGCGGTVIEDAISGTLYGDTLEDEDGNEVIISDSVTGIIKKVIVDWTNSCVKDTDDKFFPVMERDTITANPVTATSQDEVTSFNEVNDTDVTIDERRPLS